LRFSRSGLNLTKRVTIAVPHLLFSHHAKWHLNMVG
jgi:hypothetical protein